MSKGLKIFLWIVIFLVVIFFVASAALPTFVSSTYGAKITLKMLNANLKGKLTLKQIKVSWFGNQHLNDLKYEDDKGTTLFSLPSLDANASLFHLLFGGKSSGKIHLQDPYFLWQKTSNAKEERKKEKEDIVNEIARKTTRFDQAIEITNGTIVFSAENIQPITLYEIYLNKTGKSEKLTLHALTTQGTVQGMVSVDGHLGEQMTADIQISNFPVAILDTIFHSQLYAEGIGTSLDLQLNLIKDVAGPLSIKGSAKSANLIATIEGFKDENRFIVSPKSHLNLTITPSFFKAIIHEKQRGSWELASKTELAVHIENAIFPLTKNLSFKDIILQAQANISRAELHHSTLGSYSLKQFDITAFAQNNIDFHLQGEIQGKESTNLLGQASITPEGDILFDYTCNGFPVTLLELISPQMEQKIRMLLGSQFDIEGKGTYLSKFLDTQATLKSQDAQIVSQLTGYFPEWNLELSGSHKFYGEKTKILGGTLNFTLSAAGQWKEGHLTIPFLKGNLSNPFYEFDLQGQVGEEGMPFSLDQMQMIALGHINKLPIEENTEISTLQNGVVFFQIDGSKNLMTGKIEAQSINANFTLFNFIHDDAFSFDQADLQFTSEMSNFPVAILSPLVSENIDLSTFVGKTVSIDTRGSYTSSQQPRLSFDINAKGLGFATSLSVAIDETLTVKQNRPSYVYWEMTPARYDALMSFFRLNPEVEPTFSLLRPTPIELNITHFTCPTTPVKSLGHFLCQSGFVGDLDFGTMIFRSQYTNESIAFQQMQGSIKGENFSKAIDLSLSGKIVADDVPKSEESMFSFSGQMLNFWKEEGKFNREGLTVKGELNLDLLPVRPITGIVPIDHETRAIIQAVLGDLVNARISGEISQLAGPITIDVKSSNFKATLPLLLQKHALYLRDYVDAEITFTQAVNETLLKDINPLITGAYSDHPIKVYVDPAGFSVPLRPYSLANVQIAKAIFDIGKIYVRNGGQTQSLMQFLNAKEITPDGTMEAWFTPIFMTLHNGVASYKRFDALLASKVHTAMWGSVNLINNQVNMTLAIAPTTLYERFKISGLTKKDMFQVQMRGTTDKLELDWSSAYTRIAWIVARSSAGFITDILGGILEQLVSKQGEEPAPPPTTDPLPWESIYSSERL